MAAGVAATAIRYYFDEHVRSPVAAYLRTHHIDVLTTQEAGRSAQGIDDADQLAFATMQNRVLVSRDKHFLNPHEVPQIVTGQHAGVIAIRKEVGIGDEARYLRYAAETETMESMAGQIRYYAPIPRGLFPDD